MNFERTTVQPKQERGVLLSKLTDPKTVFAERMDLAKLLFPEWRKQEMLERADKDRKGRPVRYFRLVTYGELKAILEAEDVNGVDNQHIQETFARQSKKIEEGLKMFMDDEGIRDEFRDDLNELSSNFTLKKYRQFVQTKIPLSALFRLHVSVMGGGSSFTGATGLSSLSVGAPYQPPYDPSERRHENQEGIPVIEMVIPSEKVYLNPRVGALKEMEKEVNTTTIKPEWITDIYCGIGDFAKRFVRDPGTVLFSGFKDRCASGEIFDEWISDRNVWDILQEWKGKEDIVDLIPASKVDELDPTNPRLQKPLKESR